MTKRIRARGEDVRRYILEHIEKHPHDLTKVAAEHFGITRQAVSKHLRILEEANLISSEKQGREKLHYLNAVPIHAIAERWIGKFERPRLGALSELKKRLEGEKR